MSQRTPEGGSNRSRRQSLTVQVDVAFTWHSPAPPSLSPRSFFTIISLDVFRWQAYSWMGRCRVIHERAGRNNRASQNTHLSSSSRTSTTARYQCSISARRCLNIREMEEGKEINKRILLTAIAGDPIRNFASALTLWNPLNFWAVSVYNIIWAISAYLDAA